MKSFVSDQLSLALTIYRDVCARCPADVSDLRDTKTIVSRVEHEGVSFLTITLPAFCKGFERALDEGYIDPSWRKTHFRGFPFHGSIPAFLQGMIGLVFDCETGRIYDENHNDNLLRSLAIDCVRQICLAFKKLELPCTPARVDAAIANFIEVERTFNDFSVPTLDTSEFLRVSACLWDNHVYRLRDSMLIPRHGPGATAERIAGNGKYAWRYWYDRLDQYFPLFENGYPASALDSKEVEEITFVPENEELPVRVTPVPKTLKGPRIIAIEPVCMQYAQQAIRSLLYQMIEEAPVTRGHINFRDQSVNQNLALIASSTGRLATIDLSDASDRVPRDLALEMFNGYPEFRELVDACRSRSALLPRGEIISPLRKFASMGSALCFPVESMYFYTICVAALLKASSLPVSYENCYLVSRDIYVYGDDIIVPSRFAGIVSDYLQKYNCKVNASKSFWNGSFRESCGVDAYAGTQVTPVYIRQTRPRNKQQVKQLISWSATANLFYKKGMYETAELMHSVCEKILKVYPEVPENSAALGRIYRINSVRPKYRFNAKLHRREIRAWCSSSVYRTDKIDGYAALQKSLLKLEAPKAPTVDRNVLLALAKGVPIQSETTDPLHLERSALHATAALTLRWVSPTIG